MTTDASYPYWEQDRVKHRTTEAFGTVVEDQGSDTYLVGWDEGESTTVSGTVLEPADE